MTTRTAPRRRPWARWLMLALLVVPVIEVFIIIKVGQSIGGWNTLALLVAWSALGAWIVKREFGRAFRGLREAFATGRMPARELADAALVLIGGTLLLAPGFLTDAIGLVFLAPFTRPVMRRLLEGAVASRMFGGLAPVVVGSTGPFVGHDAPYPTPDSFARTSHDARRGSTVVEGEIID